MLVNSPILVSILFIATVIFTLILFTQAIRNANTLETRKKTIPILYGLFVWLALQIILSLNNVYSANLNAFPPKIFLFGILPAFIMILLLFNTRKGTQFADSLPLKYLTYLHIIRIPVELVLYWLFVNKAVPELMTFAGRNFDILSGITAPIIAYFGITKGIINTKLVIVWNIICLMLLINIVVHAFLSAPTPLQQFAFDQPNIAIFYFPFSLLPTFIVPIVFIAHLISIRQLLLDKYATSKTL
jgi:hypothetical protein